MSTVSSRYSSSSTSFSSVLEKPWISSSCWSLSSSTNTSAACSLGSSRNTRGSICSSRSPQRWAISGASSGRRRSRSSAYRFREIRSSILSTMASCCSSSSNMGASSFPRNCARGAVPQRGGGNRPCAAPPPPGRRKDGARTSSPRNKKARPLRPAQSETPAQDRDAPGGPCCRSSFSLTRR